MGTHHALPEPALPEAGTLSTGTPLSCPSPPCPGPGPCPWGPITTCSSLSCPGPGPCPWGPHCPDRACPAWGPDTVHGDPPHPARARPARGRDPVQGATSCCGPGPSMLPIVIRHTFQVTRGTAPGVPPAFTPVSCPGSISRPACRLSLSLGSVCCPEGPGSRLGAPSPPLRRGGQGPGRPAFLPSPRPGPAHALGAEEGWRCF